MSAEHLSKRDVVAFTTNMRSIDLDEVIEVLFVGLRMVMAEGAQVLVLRRKASAKSA